MSSAAPAGPGSHPDRRTPVERALRVFTDVRAGEGRTAILLFVNVLLILCAYYCVKPLREGWLAVSDVGALSKMELKAYSSFGQSLLLVGLVSVYGRLVPRWSRQVLITRTTLFFMVTMVGFWLIQPNFFVAYLPGTGIAFYLWVGIFGAFVVAQFWAFAADSYSEPRGRRLLPLVAIGATSGAVIGSALAERLVASRFVGAEYLLVAALVPLAVGLWITRVVDAGSSSPPVPAPGPELPAGTRQGALRLVLSTRFLLAVGLVTLLLNWVNTNGENLLFRVVQEVIEADLRAQGTSDPEQILKAVRDGTTAFYSDFFFWVNLVALLLQAFVASRLLRYGGFGALFLLLPVIVLGSYTAMSLVPVLAVIKVMKIAENSTDYSLQNTARHVLWLPLARETTFKAKPTIDLLFVRTGDGLAALTVLVGLHVFSLPLRAFFAVNIVLVGLWLALAAWVVFQHGRLERAEKADAHS